MKFVETRAGGRLAYARDGNGPTTLCLPSGGELQSQYRFLTPLLVAAGYSVVVMDLRGQGASSAFWQSYRVAELGIDALSVLDAEDIADAAIIGPSIAWQSAFNMRSITLTGYYSPTGYPD